jgi:hypothetical protein
MSRSKQSEEHRLRERTHLSFQQSQTIERSQSLHESVRNEHRQPQTLAGGEIRRISQENMEPQKL